MAINAGGRLGPMTLGRLGALLVSVAILGSCGGAAPSGSGAADGSGQPVGSARPSTGGPTANASAGAVLGDQAWVFDPATPSTDLVIGLDDARHVDAVVPLAGGRVSATGADGTIYELEIPANALLDETTIGLTPVASIEGLPFGGPDALAVQLSPDGLVLSAPAVLTITPTEPIPADRQIPFGYLADGKDVILARPVFGTADLRIEVDHFSGNGITRGILADTEPALRRHGGTTERRLSDAIAAEVIRIRQAGGQAAGPETTAAFEAVMREYQDTVVAQRVAAAGESCAAGRAALQTVLGLDRQRHLVGLDATGTILDDYPGLVEKVARVCVLEEFELCVEEHVIHRMAVVWRSFERQFEQLSAIVELDGAPLREARDLTVRCLTFRLDLESTGVVDAGEGSYESTVESEVTLRFDPEDNTISGTAPLDNTAFEFKATCGATSIKGGGTFEVGKLRILTAQPDQDSGSYRTDDGKDLDFLLAYLPGPTSESAKINICGSAGAPLPLPPFPAWTGTFLATHKAELDTTGELGGGYIAIDWEVFGNEYFAKKEWIKESGDIVEAGTFKLYHIPGG